MSAQRSDIPAGADDPLEVSDLGLDDILDAAGLDDPARGRHSTRNRIGAALKRAEARERGEIDVFEDLGQLDFDESAPEVDFGGDRPFRYSAPPVPGIDAADPEAATDDPADPFGATMAEPLSPELELALDNGAAPDGIDVGPTLVIERTEGSGAHQVADLLQRGMQRRGYTPMKSERVSTGEAPTIDPDDAMAADVHAQVMAAAAPVDGVPVDEDSAVDGVPVDEDSAVDGVPVTSAVDGVPVEDAPTRRTERSIYAVDTDLELDVDDLHSKPPQPLASGEMPTLPPEPLQLDVDAFRTSVGVDAPQIDAPAPPPRSNETYVMGDLPEGVEARARRERTSTTPREERKRVRHGDDRRVLGRAAVSSKAFGGIREERNSARERGLESLLLDYVAPTVTPSSVQAVGSDAPAAGILRRKGQRRGTKKKR